MCVASLLVALFVALLPAGGSTGTQPFDRGLGSWSFPHHVTASRPHAVHRFFLPLRGGDTSHSDPGMSERDADTSNSPVVGQRNSSNAVLPEIQEALDWTLADPHTQDSVRGFFTEEQIRASAVSLSKMIRRDAEKEDAREAQEGGDEEQDQDEEDEDEDDDPFEAPMDRIMRRIAQDPDYQAYEAKMELRAEAENMTTACSDHQSFAVTQAIRTGSSSKLEQILRECPDLVSRLANTSLGFSPLHLAASTTEEAAREALAERGGEREEEGEDVQGVAECARLLLAAGFDVDARDESARCPAAYAVLEDDGHQGVLELLVSHGADLNLPDAAGRTPLHWAVLGGSVETVQRLVHAGADPSLRTSPCPTFPLAMSAVELAEWSARTELARSLQPDPAPESRAPPPDTLDSDLVSDMQ